MKKNFLFVAMAALLTTISVAQVDVGEDGVVPNTADNFGTTMDVDSLSLETISGGWELLFAGGTPYQPAVIFFGSVDATESISTKMSFNEFGSISVDLAHAYVYPNVFFANSLGYFPFIIMRPNPMPPELLGLEVGVQAAWLDWTVTAPDGGAPVYDVTAKKSNVVTIVIQ